MKQDIYRQDRRAIELGQAVGEALERRQRRRPDRLTPRLNFQPYSGINIVLLWMSMVERGFSDPVHITFKQAQALGGNVRKGERGTMVVFADKMVKKDEETDKEKVIPFLKNIPHSMLSRSMACHP